MELGDNEAVAQSLAGQPDAFATLVHRHGQAVHGYLFRRSDRQTADDLSGEVWLRAFRSRRGYDQQWQNARPWLYGIAGNTLRAHWRLQVLERDDLFERSQDPWPHIDARLDASGQGLALREALRSLRQEEREVLLLVAWEHLSPAEVATSLGIPQGTARWRLHRARTLLRRYLEANGTVRSSNAFIQEV